MSDVFNEVDEELRRDKASELFERYRPLMIALTLAIVLGVSGYKGWEWYSLQQKAKAAESYNAAAELYKAGDLAGADKAFADFAIIAPKGYAALALMQQASVKTQEGKIIEAASLYTRAAEQFDDPFYRDIAVLRAILVVVDDLTLADLDAKLASLTGPGQAFRFTARELLAVKAFEEGNTARAREDYTYISLALDAPAGARTRAGQALALLGPEPQAIKTNTGTENEETTQ